MSSADDLKRDLSLHNDVLYSLFTVCRLVIDFAGELSSRKGKKYDDYTEAVRNLSAYPEISPQLIRDLEKLPGFRNVLIHEYIVLDLERAVKALEQLEPVEEFLQVVKALAG